MLFRSNSAYAAINLAIETVRKTGNLPVPLHLRNAPTKLMKEIGYGENYKYAHKYSDHFIQEYYLPDEIKENQFYTPGRNAREEEMRSRLNQLWKEMKSYGKE